MTSLAVLFWYGSSFSLFSRKLVEFGAYANALDHLHCSHGVLSVFYNIFYFRKQISLPSLKAVVSTCICAISLDHLDFRLYLFGSHCRNRDEFIVTFFWYGSSSSLFSRKLVEFGAYANALDHLDCSHGVHSVFYNIFFISGSKSLSHHWRQLLALKFVLFILTI